SLPMRGLRPWLRVLHFGPSVFTTAAFGVYIALAARGLGKAQPGGPLALLLAGQLATQFAISLLNDYWDLPLDRVAQPDKPIPAGRFTAVAVRAWGWGLAAT